MNMCHGVWRSGLLAVLALGWTACSNGPESPSERVGNTGQALVSQDKNVQSSIAVFKQANVAGSVCTGVVVGRDVVLTSTSCVNQIHILTTLNDDYFIATVTGTSPDVSFETNLAPVSLNALTVGPLAFVQTPTGSVVGATTASVATGDTVSIQGVNSNENDAVYFGSPVQIPGLVVADPDTLDGLHLCLPTLSASSTVDAGAPVFKGTSLVGIVDQYVNCTGGVGFIPSQNFPQFKTGTFSTTNSNAAFTAVLGGSGPAYDVSVFLPRSAFGSNPPRIVTANTGIPKAFKPTSGAATTLSIHEVSSAVDYIQVAAGTDPTLGDPSVSGTTTTPPTLRSDLGTIFRLAAADVVGSPSSVVPQPSWKGFPSAYEGDGRFTFIGAAGLNTAQVFTAKFEVTDCPNGTIGSGQLQIFDPDTDQSYDTPGAEAQKTCIQIFGDTNENEDNEQPCGVLEEGQGTFIPSTTNGTWFNVVPTCTATRYRLKVSLKNASALCDAPQSTPPAGGINGFKVRSVCNLSTINRPISFGAVDSDLAGTSPFRAMTGGPVVMPVETNYEIAGTFSYVVDVSGTANGGRFKLPNADADDCDVDPGGPNACASSGQEYAIHFLPFGNQGLLNMRRCTDLQGDPQCSSSFDWTINAVPLGNALPPAAVACTAGSGNVELCNEDPSGGFADVAGSSTTAGVRTFSILRENCALVNGTCPPTDPSNQVAILWRNVRTSNFITSFGPNGSPVIFPVVSLGSTWTSSVSALTVDGWLHDTAALAALLPLEIGKPGARFAATTVAQATALLNRGDLVSELAAAELNRKKTAAAGLALGTAVVRGTSTLLVDAIAAAEDALVTGGSQTESLGLLRVANQGLVIFATANPDLVAIDDPDGDDIPNIADNCPTRYNPQQENTTIDDDIGDACDPIPLLDCVVQHSSSSFTAYFGYDNPWIDRRIEDVLNSVSPAPADRGQPILQRAGTHHNAFSADFTAPGSLTWHLAGSSVTASSSSPRCAGGQDTQLKVNERVVLLGANGVQLGDRTKLTNFDNIAAGNAGVHVGFDSLTGDIDSRGSITTDARVHVTGSLRSNGAINLGQSTIVDGLSITPAGVVVDSIARQIPNPPSRTTLANVDNDKTFDLTTPGNYQGPLPAPRVFRVGDRSTLILHAGVYDFTGLVIGNDSHIVLDDAAGVVQVIVRGASPTGTVTLSIGDRTTTSSQTGGHPRIELVYLGTTAITVPSTFAGSVVAPNATLNLVRRPLNNQPVATFFGTFFASSIVADNDLRFVFVPLNDE